MEPRSSFVNLHVHSSFSLLDGCLKIKDLVAKAKAHDMPACVVTDHGNMCAMLHLYKECQKQEMKPIIGTEFYVAHSGVQTKDEIHKKANHLVLIAKNEIGQRNLTKLNTMAHSKAGFYYKPRVDSSWLGEHKEGLICLSGCLQGELSYAVIKGNGKMFWETLSIYREYYGEDFYIEIQVNSTELQKQVNKVLKDVALQERIPMVLTTDTHYLNRSNAKDHNNLLAIQTRDFKFKFPTDEFFFYTPEDIYRVAQDEHDVRAIMNTLEVAEKCHLTLDLGKLYMPEFNVTKDQDWEEYQLELSAAL